ncbi:membrane protein [Sphaerisporangium melleum]|uniref:Membrane protein n=1 Tax=Sphaerisporangium melleum TaxID=321316 RepID=A0A917VLL4_9ACTN|nr:YcnI family protein [Sphaerisporangium melleum]GGK93655.1 membrane protein [Sphaerisporangium melleum]GII73387.1 membrane protein [Sphaerisporangium melleum]
MPANTVIRRVALVPAGALALVAALALPALAHVSINPGTAEKGGFSKVAFRVPNERDKASTTKVVIYLPVDHPLPFVSVRPVPGWKVEVTESKLAKPVPSKYGEITEAVTKITWSGGKIGPHQFQEFEVSMGILPEDTDQMLFPATQTYSNGEVVKWDDEPKADGSEAEHPVPTLKLVAAGASEDDHHASPAASPAASAAPAVAVRATGAGGHGKAASDGTARLLGAAGIVVGLAGLVVGFTGRRRARGTTGD